MKNSILTLILCFVSFGAFAQSNIGFKASIGAIPTRPETVFVGNQTDYVTHKITFASASPVSSFGIYAKKIMGWSYFQMDAMYSNYKLGYDVTDFIARSFSPERVEETYKNVDLVVNAGITSNNFRLGFGPVFHIVADHESAFDNIPTFNERLRGFSYGFSGAIGYDIGNLAIDFRYENALTTIGDHVYFGEARSKFKTGANQITLSVGYGF
ncbi:MAG: hypothetical protein RLZZ546_356 [Bacteroidota bacterium]|jgi:hypothetical protein